MYNAKQWSYKELPVRYAEFGTVYRYEQSGELHGLTRARGFTQDDAHIFCTQDQLNSEFKNVIDLVLYVFKSLGFEKFTAQVSLRDPLNKEKYIGKFENGKKHGLDYHHGFGGTEVYPYRKYYKDGSIDGISDSIHMDLANVLFKIL